MFGFILLGDGVPGIGDWGDILFFSNRRESRIPKASRRSEIAGRGGEGERGGGDRQRGAPSC
jgi:hypothetical protein